MVWQDVLPVNVYCKAMGALLNTALAEIVTRIAALEVTAMGVLGTAFVTSRSSPHNHISGEQFIHTEIIYPREIFTIPIFHFTWHSQNKPHCSSVHVLPIQDISAEDADRLYSLCRIMVEEGPQVFTPLLEEDKNKKYQEEVPVYVQKWMTFKELMIILQANLQEIVDQ